LFALSLKFIWGQQCTRLNHECDYSPKLAFKDETPKIVDKYLGPNSPGANWNREYLGRKVCILIHIASASLEALKEAFPPDESDNLPPFTALTNDEEWQKKAVYSPPGTYYVVANSDSFADVEEYKTASRAEGHSDFIGTSSSRGFAPNIPVDDATVILGTFEESPRKQSSSSGVPMSRTGQSISMGFEHLENGKNISMEVGQHSQHIPMVDFSEANLQFHWRSHIRRLLFRVSRDVTNLSIDVEDYIELEAHNCPPVSLWLHLFFGFRTNLTM
jgi:hypothetical protein